MRRMLRGIFGKADVETFRLSGHIHLIGPEEEAL